MDLPRLDISYKWNHTVCGLLTWLIFYVRPCQLQSPHLVTSHAAYFMSCSDKQVHGNLILLYVYLYDHSGNRHSLCFIGEEPKAERLYSWPKVIYISNGRAGTYTQVAFCFFLLVSSVKIHGDLSHLSPLNKAEYLTLTYMFRKWMNGPGS